jgi:hypothetical protein
MDGAYCPACGATWWSAAFAVRDPRLPACFECGGTLAPDRRRHRERRRSEIHGAGRQRDRRFHERRAVRQPA